MAIKLLKARKINGAIRNADEIIHNLPSSFEDVLIAAGEAESIPDISSEVSWSLDAYGEPDGLLGPDNESASALVAHAADHEAMGIAVAKELILESVLAGQDTGWLPAAPEAERIAFELLSGASAQLTIDASTDGVTSAAQLATVSLDTTGVQLVSPPLWHRYPYFKVTHLSGVGVVNVARAV